VKIISWHARPSARNETSKGFFAATIREVLNIEEEYKLLFGISFGYPDYAAPGNRFGMGRLPITDSVTFHS